jgi:hypothetical protein
MGMGNGAWNATEVDSVIVPADSHVGEVRVQVLSGGPIYLAYGVPAVVGEGLYLVEGGSHAVNDYRANLDVHAICGAGASASGGFSKA